MKYTYCAATHSTTHTTFEKEFKSELSLRRYLSSFLREYEIGAYALIRREDGRRAQYARKQKKLYWS